MYATKKFKNDCPSNDFLILKYSFSDSIFIKIVFILGIPELGIGDVEPVLIDEINLALGSGPNGYRATFRDIEAYGVSNLTINSVRYVNSIFLNF